MGRGEMKLSEEMTLLRRDLSSVSQEQDEKERRGEAKVSDSDHRTHKQTRLTDSMNRSILAT